MRRTRVLFLAFIATLSLAIPARAHDPQGGRVLLPVAAPGIAQAEYNNLRANGRTGYVLPLAADADDKSYTLTAIGGLTGFEDFDAWFFEDREGSATGPGTMCGTVDSSQHGAVETGRICPNDQKPAWVVVTLFTGANGVFLFHY